MIALGDAVGTACTRKWTWSPSVPISRKLMSYRDCIPRQSSLSVLATPSVSTSLRYFTGQPMWYRRSDLLWLRVMWRLPMQETYTDSAALAAELRGNLFDYRLLRPAHKYLS